MSQEFGALAAMMAKTVDGLQACFLTRDGLIVDSFPARPQENARKAWVRLASLGDFEKGFLEFENEMWVYLQRGAHAVFAVATLEAQPGRLMDVVDELLGAMEEAREQEKLVLGPRPESEADTGAPVTYSDSQSGGERGSESTLDKPDAKAGQAKPSRPRPKPVSWVKVSGEQGEEEGGTGGTRKLPERRPRPVSWIMVAHETVRPAEAQPASEPSAKAENSKAENSKVEPDPGSPPAETVGDDDIDRRFFEMVGDTGETPDEKAVE